MMCSTFSASKTCQKRLRGPSDLDSAVSLGGGRTGKYVNKWNIFKTPQMNSDVLLEAISCSAAVLGGVVKGLIKMWG